jgi:DNA-directed RNA polymerase specialized sigma24 family protein
MAIDATPSFDHIMAGLSVSDQDAAKKLYERYIDQLIRLAARKLDRKLGARVDPESVAHSVFESFFEGLQKAEFELHNWGMVFGLLAHITFNKCLNRRRFHTQKKRDAGLVVSFDDWQAVATQPGPVDEAVMTELVEKALAAFDDDDRAIIDTFMSGVTKDESAKRHKCSVRSVERVLQEFRENLEALLGTDE